MRAHLLVLLALPACGGCIARLLPPQPGAASRAEATHLCDVLESAQRAGLRRDALFVDVGASQGNAAKMASAHGHAVASFECRLDAAQQLASKPWWTPEGTVLRMPSSVKIVSSCVSDHVGLAALARALDSSSMADDLPWVKATGANLNWKARRDGGINETKIEAVPVVRLDDALSNRSLSALKLPAKVGFIKSDTNGNDLAVLRGAVKTLHRHRPAVYFERKPLADGTPSTDKGSNTLECRLLDELGLRSLGYSCSCDTSDCLWVPDHLSGMDAPRLMGTRPSRLG